MAHNIFTVPVLSPTFSILKWTKDELEKIDIQTRKLISLNGSFHLNSDVDRLDTLHSLGRRGLNSVVDIYISTLISLSTHIKQAAPKHPFIKLVMEHETNSLHRISDEAMNYWQSFISTSMKTQFRKHYLRK